MVIKTRQSTQKADNLSQISTLSQISSGVLIWMRPTCGICILKQPHCCMLSQVSALPVSWSHLCQAVTREFTHQNKTPKGVLFNVICTFPDFDSPYHTKVSLIYISIIFFACSLVITVHYLFSFSSLL